MKSKLVELPEEEFTLNAYPQAVGYGALFGFSLGFLIHIPIMVVYMAITSIWFPNLSMPGIYLATIVLGSIVGIGIGLYSGLVTWRWTQIKCDQQRIVIYGVDGIVFESRWTDIASYKSRFFSSEIRSRDGLLGRIPTLIMQSGTREAKLLQRQLQSYSPPAKEFNPKKWFVYSTATLAAGLPGVFLLRRPTDILASLTDAPTIKDWMAIGASTLSIVCLMVGAFGLLGLLSFKAESSSEKADVKKRMRKPSRFGPSLHETFELLSQYPKPQELEVGKTYRYLDPDAILSSTKEFVGVSWFLISVAVLLSAGVVSVAASTDRLIDQVMMLVLGLLNLLLTGGIGVWTLVKSSTFRKTIDWTFRVEDDSIVVTTQNEILHLNREPVKTSKYLISNRDPQPGSQGDTFTDGHKTYKIDRRFLWPESSSDKLENQSPFG